METKKTEKADLENKRSTMFQIGLATTLVIVLFALDYQTPIPEKYYQTDEVPGLEIELLNKTDTTIKPPQRHKEFDKQIEKEVIHK